MAEKIYIGNFQKGLVLNPLPFNIDNDSFPTLYNFYAWRGRAKKKRGTSPLGRFTVQVALSGMQLQLTSGSVNLITALSLPSTSSIVSGSISFTVGGNVYTEPMPYNGTLSGSPSGTGTINYATGALTITGGGSSYVTGTFSYYPELPVMGLEDYIPLINAMSETVSSPYPQLLGFDTQYSYQNFTASNLGMTSFYNVNYYKNPPSTTYSGYTKKTTQTPFTWNGTNYQQFWTTNFEQALWATNGNPGMQVQAIATIAYASSTTVTLTTSNPSPAVEGDFVFVNEITGTDSNTINGQTGYVTNVSGMGVLTIKFPNADIANQTYSGGIIQYLTNTVSGNTGDGIKWYDGDPTLGTGLPSSSAAGWVNFAPPLSATGVTIANFSSGTFPFYLVGCKMMMAYKDRMLFFGPYIATSATMIAGNAPIYLQDKVLWSWNGAAFYTSSFNATSAPIVYNPILTPGTGISGITPEGGAVLAYYVDQTGLGGWLAAGLQQQIVTLGINEDVLIVGFSGRQLRLGYTSNDLSPFLFFTINSELGASATFSGVTLDRGVVTFGTYGFALTSQTASQRIDLQIPDLAFQIKSTNFGVQRINGVRDFYKEWLYFSYCPDTAPSTSIFPTQTFFYNYREETWAIFYENFTSHGSFWRYAALTWATLPYQTWTEWVDSWASEEAQALFPAVVAGTPQGFVVVKGVGTGEAPTGSIAAAVAYTSSSPNYTQITSYNHCVSQSNAFLEAGDYLYISGCVGTVNLNGQIGQVVNVIDANNFVIDIPFRWNISNITNALQAVVSLNIDPYQQHNFIVGESVAFSGISGMTELNGNSYVVTAISSDTITINVDSTGYTAYTGGGVASPTPYLGLGVFTRLIQPLIQSKQFPPAWGIGKQVRFGTQQYLLDYTANAQVTLDLYLSMDPDNAWNSSTQVQDPNDPNNAIIYSQILFTCPESTNIGLTPANTNLQMPTASTQRQIWHRMNTSLIGDTVQFGITLNDAQMRNLTYAISEITLHAAVFDIYPGPYLS